MKKKLIIFDLDGTLIDTLSDIEHIFNYVLIKNGLEKKSKNFYKKNIGNGLENLLRKCLPDSFTGDFDSLSKSVRDRYKSQLNTKTKIYEGIIPVLEYLKKNKVSMAVISNKLHSLAVRSVETYFYSYRMKVIGAEGGFPRKPSPDSTLHMLQNFNCSASDTLFVGDSIVDIKTAQNANISSVAVLWGNGKEEDFKKQKSDFILENPQDLLGILS
mgnify:CR=1 FL=1